MNKTLKDEIKDCEYPTFSSQDEAIVFVKKMLNPYISKSKAILPNDKIFNKLYCLFECHEDINRKLPNGETVISFRVFINHYGNLATNYIVNTGREDDFSWTRCAKNLVRIEKGQVSTDVEIELFRYHVITALRDAVQYQHERFKKEYKLKHDGHFFDAVTHEELNENNVDIDHKDKTFGEIADDWLDTIGGINQVDIKDTHNSQRGFEMSDPDQKKDWQIYHKNHVHYQVLSQHNNRSKGSDGYKMRH